MEMNGKVVAIMDVQRFVSHKTGNEVVRHGFVIETQEQYPRKACFTVLGDDRWQKMQIVMGASYCVSFDIESREYQGKWYNQLNAWKAVSLQQGQA